MFGEWFYHKRVRTCVSIFGSLFNNLYVLRENSAGEIISQVKVPLSYAPKRNFLERIEAMSKGEDAERTVAVKLPRMSFEMTAWTYDSIRQLPKTNHIIKALENSQKRRIYTATPYELTFDLNIYAKSQDDALQIVEQIVPYFAPQYTLTVKPFTDIPDIKEDIPITLSAITTSDDFEGAIENRRTIVYTLSFQMKVNFYGPINEGEIIREVNTNIYNIADSDTYLETINVVPTPVGVSPDSDYGFNITFNQDGPVV